MKKVFIIFSFLLFVLVGCGKNAKSITTLEEFKSMKSNGYYNLKTDIDLSDEEWETLDIKGINGNGHTIKNAYMLTSSDFSENGFFGRVEYIKDIVFENININLTLINNIARDDYLKRGYIGSYSAPSLGIAAGFATKYVDNVTVKNCEAKFLNNIDYGFLEVSGVVGGCDKVSNSQVLDTNITIDTKYSNTIYFGGVVGSSNEVSNCKTINSNFVINSKKDVAAGGVVGHLDGNNFVHDSLTYNSKIEINSNSKEVVRCGGVVGFLTNTNKDILRCASYKNNINITTLGSYTVGGTIAKTESRVIDCFSGENNITCNSSTSDKNNSCYASGLCGSTTATISKSISQNNIVNGISSTVSKNMFTSGFLGYCSASVANCASLNNEVYGGYKDVFSPKYSDVINNSFIGENITYPNVNELEVITNSNLKNAIEKLSLDNNIWTVQDNTIILKIILELEA